MVIYCNINRVIWKKREIYTCNSSYIQIMLNYIQIICTYIEITLIKQVIYEKLMLFQHV